MKSYNPGQTSLGQYCTIHVSLSFLGSLFKQCILFENFLAVTSPPTLYKVETRKKFWILASNIVCGVRGGVGPVWILENTPEMLKCPKTLHSFEIFLQFSLPSPYTKLKLRKNSGYTSPTLFVGWGEGLDLCEYWQTPQKCKSVPKVSQECPSL